MHKKTNLKMLLILLSFCIVFVLSPAVNSDGCIFIPTIDSWIGAPEENQIGLINYNKGLENLTIVVDVRGNNLQVEQALWLFPVPSEPDDVSIDIVDSIDFYRGGIYDVNEYAEHLLVQSFIFKLVSQPQFVMAPLIWVYMSGSIGAAYDSNDLTVYQHIEKKGLTTEVIETKNSEALSYYLSEKNITLFDNATQPINEYIGENYSFVVSWISNVTEFKNHALVDHYKYEPYWEYHGYQYFMLGVSISFPTDDIYYPLRLTSIYDDKKIPILLQINNFVTLETSIDGTDVEYLMDGDLPYTQVNINTEARNLKEDLWIKNTAPYETHLGKYVSDNIILISIVIFILCSCTASVLSGLIIYRKQNPILNKFFLFGFLNFTTLVGFFIASFVLKIDQTFVENPLPPKEKIKKHLSKNDKIFFYLLISAITALVIFLLFVQPYVIFAIFVTLLFFGPFVGVILMFVYGLCKDKQKTKFTFLFSVFYLLFETFTFIFFISII
jgi:hypothetical protein